MNNPTHKEAPMKRHRHGLTKHLMYSQWCDMRHRCNNPNGKTYAYYGGRGIKVCPQWDDFSVYLKDIGEKPGKDYTLDRIDNNGDYEPGNVRWARKDVQAFNTRITSRNTSGVRGVSFNTMYGVWEAFIFKYRKKKFLGNFKNKDDAIAARKAAESEFFAELGMLQSPTKKPGEQT